MTGIVPIFLDSCSPYDKLQHYSWNGLAGKAFGDYQLHSEASDA
jgi:hypothetical protein